ncbi:MAG TPA: hypothetical protein VFV47_05160, partial [Hyphomicrobiaceae bacterium]|nr:hypothetical protein [Hyphomicrobiaceae bacterium]
MPRLVLSSVSVLALVASLGSAGPVFAEAPRDPGRALSGEVRERGSRVAQQPKAQPPHHGAAQAQSAAPA